MMATTAKAMMPMKIRTITTVTTCNNRTRQARLLCHYQVRYHGKQKVQKHRQRRWHSNNSNNNVSTTSKSSSTAAKPNDSRTATTTAAAAAMDAAATSRSAVSKPASLSSFSSFDNLKSFGIGTTAGLMGSLAGMGGGFVMIPLMTHVLKLSQHQAHGTSLFAVAATGLAGAVSYGSAVQVEPALAVALTGMVTARLGAQTTTILSEQTLKRALGVLMIVMSVAVPAKANFMEQYDDDENHSKQQTQKITSSDDSGENETKQEPSLLQRIGPAAAIGTCSGYMAGLFGVGGGVIVVPALTLFTSCNHYEALGTSLAAMALPAMAGTWTHHKAGNLAVRVAPSLAIGALVGAAVGGQIARRTDESTLRWGFSGLLATLGFRTLLKA